MNTPQTPTLDAGAIKRINTGSDSERPLLQVYEISQMQSRNPPERYRLLLSDGVHFQLAMLSTQLNQHIKQGRLKNFSVIQLKDYVCNSTESKRIVVVLDLEVIVSDVNKLIGSPSSYSTTEPVSSHTHQPPKNQTRVISETLSSNPSAKSFPHMTMPTTVTAIGSSSSFSGGAPDPMLDGIQVLPIRLINQHQTSFTIKVRVTFRSDIKTWANEKNSGKLFFVNLLDSYGGEIRATCFNELVDAFYDLLSPQKVVFISKAQVKLSRSRTSSSYSKHSEGGNYELVLNSNSFVVPCEGDTEGIPVALFNIVPISHIAYLPRDEIVDVMGLVIELSPSATFTTKAKKEVTKREVVLLDQSRHTIRLTLWEEKCSFLDILEKDQLPDEQYALNSADILVVKKARVSEFNGKSLTTSQMSVLELNPDCTDAHKLRAWYLSTKRKSDLIHLSQPPASRSSDEVLTISHIRDISQQRRGSEESNSAEFHSLIARVSFIKHETVPWYTSCSKQGCFRKVINEGRKWKCYSCGSEYEHPLKRYAMQMCVVDATGSLWLGCFDEVGKIIMDTDATALDAIRESNMDLYEDTFSRALFQQFRFRIRAKEEIYQDRKVTKYSVVKLEHLNYQAEAALLIKKIQGFYT